jgi:P27 family predicted phage terminase small subunit
MRGRKAELKSISGGLAGVPRAPDHVPADMVAEWDTVAADLHGRKLLTASMLGVLSTYMIALWSVRQAQEAIAEHGPLVKGAHKAPKPNPALGMLSKSLDAVARLSAELGLTAAARSKKTLQPHEGETHDGAPAGMDL